MFNLLKGLFAPSGGAGNVELGIPPHPSSQSTLFLGSPETICRQYLSMEAKTASFIELARTTNSFEQFANAQMRQAAYSTVAIHGFVFYLAINEAGIEHIKPEPINKLIYSDFLVDIFDFSWVMLQHCMRNSNFGNEQFGEESITAFLNSDIASEGFPILLMNYLVSEQNAFFGDKALKNQIKIKEMYGQDLDDYPSKETLLSFKEMVDARMVGDPNDILAFDAKYHQAAFTDIQQVREISVKLSDSVLFHSFMQRIVRHFY